MLYGYRIRLLIGGKLPYDYNFTQITAHFQLQSSGDIKALIILQDSALLKKSPTEDFHTQANMTPKQFFEMGDSEMKVTMEKFDLDKNAF